MTQTIAFNIKLTKKKRQLIEVALDIFTGIYVAAGNPKGPALHTSACSVGS